MKKALLVLGLGLVGGAGAQGLSLNGGISFTGGTGFHLGITANDITNIGGLGVSARVLGDFGGAGNVINVDALLSFPTVGLNLYAGPGIAIGTGGGTSFQVTGGALFPVADQFNLFAEGGFRFNGGSIFRAGIAYNF